MCNHALAGGDVVNFVISVGHWDAVLAHWIDRASSVTDRAQIRLLTPGTVHQSEIVRLVVTVCIEIAVCANAVAFAAVPRVIINTGAMSLDRKTRH